MSYLPRREPVNPITVPMLFEEVVYSIVHRPELLKALKSENVATPLLKHYIVSQDTSSSEEEKAWERGRSLGLTQARKRVTRGEKISPRAFPSHVSTKRIGLWTTQSWPPFGYCLYN